MSSIANINQGTDIILRYDRAGLTSLSYGIYTTSAQLPAAYHVYGAYPYEPISSTNSDVIANFTPTSSSRALVFMKDTSIYESFIGLSFIASADPTTSQITIASQATLFVHQLTGGLTTNIDNPIDLSHGKPGDILLLNGVDDGRTILHEMGHALGLLDASTDPKSGIKGTVFDSTKYTIMSYQNSEDRLPYSLQLLDIAALQLLYGPSGAHAGDDTYNDFSHDAFGLIDMRLKEGAIETYDALITIWDSGGTDTITAVQYAGSAYIDLRPGYFSSLGEHQNARISNGVINTTGQENVSIAFGAYIENAIGSTASDGIVGNSFSNIIHGEAGNDVIYGDDQDLPNSLGLVADYSTVSKTGVIYFSPDVEGQFDQLYGGDGDDTIHGGRGTDRIYGDAGNDHVWSSMGSDIIDGGANDALNWQDADDLLKGDTADYSLSTTIDVNTTDQGLSVIKLGGGVDILTNIERIAGTKGADTFRVNSDIIILSGSGDDNIQLDASSGTATGLIDGESGDDHIVVIAVRDAYDSANAFIRVSGGTDLLDQSAIGVTDGGVTVVATGATGGYLHTVLATQVVVDTDNDGNAIGTHLDYGRGLGAIIVSDPTAVISWSRDTVIVTSTYEGPPPFSPEGPVAIYRYRTYDAHLTIHVGSESIDVGMLEGNTEEYLSGGNPYSLPPVGESELFLRATPALSELTVEIAGVKHYLYEFDISAATG